VALPGQLVTFDRRHREFENYTTRSGTDLLQRDISACKVRPTDLAKLEALVERAERGELRRKDVAHVEGSIWELRLHGQDVIYRLLYADLSSQCVLLGLAFFNKKTQKLPETVKRIARERLRDYQSRQTT